MIKEIIAIKEKVSDRKDWISGLRCLAGHRFALLSHPDPRSKDFSYLYHLKIERIQTILLLK